MKSSKVFNFREEHTYLTKEIDSLYNGPENILFKGDSTFFNPDNNSSCNLNTISQSIKVPLKYQQNKAIIMVIGNISAGKSTFINWLLQNDVQKTGQAIETLKFTYIMDGEKFTEIRGDSALKIKPFMSEISEKYQNFSENLAVKLCPISKECLKCIDIIDTPGLADGDLQYSFPIENVIADLHSYVDLILVFLDPTGQALGSRVLSVSEKLYSLCPDKVRFCLSKVDEIRTEEDRIKIMCQTTQSLTARIKSRHGFDLVPIYVPGAIDDSYLFTSLEKNKENITSSTSVNRVEDLVNDIVQAAESRLQNNLYILQEDISSLIAKVNERLNRFQAEEQKLQYLKDEVFRYNVFRFFVLCILIALIFLQLRPAYLTHLYKYPIWAYLNKHLNRFESYQKALIYLPHVTLKIKLWKYYWYSGLYAILLFCLFPNTPSKEVIESNSAAIKACLELRSYLKMASKKSESLVKSYLTEDESAKSEEI